MGERWKTIVKIELFAIFLVSFVLFFGVTGIVSAAHITQFCSDIDDPGEWQKDDFECLVPYIDLGESALSECQYRLFDWNAGTYSPSGSNPSFYPPPPPPPAPSWFDAYGPHGENCVDTIGTINLAVLILVGPGQNCRTDGANACSLDRYAQDHALNYTTTLNVARFEIDFTSPIVSANNASSSWFSPPRNVTLSISDATSGLPATNPGRYNWDTNPMNADCTTEGTGFTNDTIIQVPEGSHRLYLCGRDNAGNTSTWDSGAAQYNVDATAPTTTSFTVNGISYPSTVTASGALTIAWTATDTGGSGIQKHEVWRAPDSGEVPGTWSKIIDPATSPETNNPANGTWWYGVHTLDNANNCINEGGGHCGGVSSDGLDPRTVRGPIKVIKDSVAPTGSIVINGGAEYTTSTSVILSLSCSDSGTGCDDMRISNDGVFDTELWEPFSSSKGWPLASCGGSRTVYAQFRDESNPPNVSSTYSDSITCDNTPPNTTITDAPPDPSFIDSASFSFTSTESGTFQCQLDGGGYSSCTSPKQYLELSQATHTFQVKAIDLAGNEDPTPASHTWQVILNNPPSISSVNDSPDPINVGSQITFQVFWSDPDADPTRIHICKTDSISGQTCLGGSWCDTATFSGSSPTSCNYTTQGADAGQKSYWAFACDDQNACSSSSSGTFLVDAAAPSISSFTATPAPPAWISNPSPDATVDWSVSDTGGSNLKQIEVWRAWDSNGDDILQSGEWDDPGNSQSNPIFTKSTGFDTPSTDTDSYVDTNLGATASYWYGLHVLDNANNLTTESTPQKVQVDKTNPVAAVTDPTPGNWYKNDFVATFDDSDLGSGLAVNCEYEFIGINPMGGDITSGVLARSCNLDTKTIGVGPDPEICQFESTLPACRVSTRAFDLAGNDSGWQGPPDYGVDFTPPAVGTPAPAIAQAGISQNYSSSLSDPIGKISSCTFFWKVSGAPEWNTGGATTIDPLPCENGGMCTVSVDHTFASSGEYDISFGCVDSALAPLNPPDGNTGWGFGAVSVDSLSVTLTANPSLGVTATLFDLTSQVAGIATGLANFKFDCANDSLWEYEVNGIDLTATDPGWVLRNGYNTKVTAPDTFAVQDLCQYGTPDTYTANTLVERGNGSAQDTTDIVVTPNTAPQATGLNHNNGTADYCFISSPPIILSWTFSDPDQGDSQSAYQAQMATDAGFTNIVVDTNKVTSSNTQYSPVGLSYATTYHWRVKVWDSFDTPSEPEWATGASFTTPVHAYPTPNFSWVPVFPSAEEEIQFTDTTTFAPGSTGQGFSWDFGDTGTSLLQNPTHVYAENGAYLVSLQATDDAGSCTRQKTVTVTLPFPEWQEISPF